MNHAVDAVQRLGDGAAVANVRLEQLYFGRQAFGRLPAGMYLFDQGIQDPHFGSARNQLPAKMAANEPRAPGYQNFLRQRPLLDSAFRGTKPRLIISRLK